MKSHKWFDVKRAQLRSRKARERAVRGWKVRHARRGALAERDPIRVGGRILRRIVVIDNEFTVRERTFYEFDRASDWKRKLREVLAA